MSDRQDTDKRRKLMAYMDDKKAMTAPELKPCPFCGGKDIRWTWHTTYSIDSSYATFGCFDCDATFPSDGCNGATEGDTSVWNRRDPAVLAELPEVKAMIAAAVRDALERAASVACNACLVDPDGGNPTEDERLVCEEAYRRIRALIPKEPK
jgi:Lar family restriction alleviation protein